MTNIRTMRDNWGLTAPLEITDEHRKPGEFVSTLHFAEVLAHNLQPDTVLTTGCSGLAVEIFQLAIPLPPERDIVCSWSLGSMGFGIPTAIGACIASGRKSTIGVEGEAGLQLNVQELATIRALGLPIKMFVLNNQGMASMRVSQERWFGRTFGADDDSGMWLPNLADVAAAYDLPFVGLDGWGDVERQVRDVLNDYEAVICEVPSPPNEQRPSQQQRNSGWSPMEVRR